MDPYLGPGAFVPSLSADQCAAALAQSAVNPPPPAQHVQPEALPVASLLMRPARTLMSSSAVCRFLCGSLRPPTPFHDQSRLPRSPLIGRGWSLTVAEKPWQRPSTLGLAGLGMRRRVR